MSLNSTLGQREQPYTENYFDFIATQADRSAKEVVPLVIKLTGCKTVIDLGCGTGTWLRVFQDNGVKEIIGVDGDYAETSRLEISKEEFIAHDLSTPFRLDQKFDLAVSLEVAEHLPEQSAEIFVRSLTQLAPIVLFSAAIPFQGGEHHVNEQWQDYWVDLFKKRGYVAVDCIRKQVWSNPNIDWWYIQNMLLFVRDNYLDQNCIIKQKEQVDVPQFSVVHPMAYLTKQDELEQRDVETVRLGYLVVMLIRRMAYKIKKFVVPNYQK